MIPVADNLHALNPLVSEALDRLDPRPLQDLARRCEQAGAQLLDLNPGYLSKRREDRMAFMVEAVQEATSLRLVLDSPNPGVLARGLAVCRETPILNALTLEERKLKEIIPLAVENQTDLIILLVNDRSFAPFRLDDKIALAIELREHALSAGLAQERLIFDPVLPNLSWPEAAGQAAESTKAIRLLSCGAIFQESVRTMAGLSNLRSGLRRKVPIRIEEMYLAVLAGAGLDYALIDVLQPELVAASRLVGQIT